MNDAFKQLSAQQIARLIQYAEAGTGDSTPDGAMLHAEKNAPWVNGMYSNIKFPPYTFQPYPKTLFNAQYLRCDEQYRSALALRSRRGDDEERARIVGDATLARAACMRIVNNPDEERALGSLWCDTPQRAVDVQEQADRAIAEAAAVSNWDDRRMGPQAQAERTAADDASETHIAEIPRTPIKPSHKKEATA